MLVYYSRGAAGKGEAQQIEQIQLFGRCVEENFAVELSLLGFELEGREGKDMKWRRKRGNRGNERKGQEFVTKGN